MATKSFLRAPKAPLWVLRNPFSAAAPPKTAAANTPIIQSFQSAQSSTQKSLFEPSALSRFLYEEQSKVEGFGFGGVRNGPLLPGDSSFGLRARAGTAGSPGDTSRVYQDETNDDEKTDWWSDDDGDDDGDDEKTDWWSAADDDDDDDDGDDECDG
ncbi:PREDICTED: PRUPE_4G182500 [Prunus dulcis]|uniref:PREDICTED: PRUPE_4G182500 n=1 Tax=Prunus dulcis TaxID=3755 RepID=A0A5E4GD99_PRUDU|nr:PREDICTED: PRUPE_4G182500 [Prunus dulcis]